MYFCPNIIKKKFLIVYKIPSHQLYYLYNGIKYETKYLKTIKIS